jgi:putative transcriptional regulator
MAPAGNSDQVRNQVRELRIERRLTQEDLGSAVGLTRQSILAIEKGRFTPSIHTALMLAQALGVSVDHIFWLATEESKEDGS